MRNKPYDNIHKEIYENSRKTFRLWYKLRIPVWILVIGTIAGLLNFPREWNWKTGFMGLGMFCILKATEYYHREEGYIEGISEALSVFEGQEKRFHEETLKNLKYLENKKTKQEK